MCSVDVVSEWEERITRQANVVQLPDPILSFLRSQQLRHLFERRIKLLDAHLLADSASRVNVDIVALLGPLYALLEFQVDHTRMLSDPPVVRFLAGQSGAMNSGLLACAHTDHLAISGIANRVRLRVLERYRRNQQISQRILAEHLVLGYHVRKRARIDFHIVSTLLQSKAEYCPRLDCVRLVFVHVESQHTVVAALFLAQNVQSFRLVARRDNAVRNFSADNSGRDHIADVCGDSEEFV